MLNIFNALLAQIAKLFYRDVFIIAPQFLDLGHSLKSFKTVTSTGCPKRLSACPERALQASKNELAGICVQTP
jgi:hypothetical protein